MPKKNDEWKTDGLIDKERADVIKTKDTSQSRVDSIAGIFSTEQTNAQNEKRARQRINDNEEYISKELAEAIRREAQEKKMASQKEGEKKRWAFIVNDEESAQLFKEYCYVHNLRIQDVFEVLVKSFLQNPTQYDIKPRK